MTGLRFLFLVPLVAPHLYALEDSAIVPLPDERYAAMAQKTPFALATAAAPAATPQASFAANWYVAGIGRLGEQYYVTIKSRDAATQFSLNGNEPSDGVSLVSVEWSETVAKSKVVLRKGTEMATLEWNEAEAKGSVAGAAPGAANPAAASPKPGTVPVNPNAAMTARSGFPTVGRPGGAGAVPMPGQTMPGQARPFVVTPMQNTRPGVPNPGEVGETRRRVMPIPAPAAPSTKP